MSKWKWKENSEPDRHQLNSVVHPFVKIAKAITFVKCGPYSKSELRDYQFFCLMLRCMVDWHVSDMIDSNLFIKSDGV